MDAYQRQRKKVILGKSFGDNVTYEGRLFIKNQQDESVSLSIRLVLFLFATIAFLLFLSGRLFYLTIVKGVYYDDLASNNRVREVVISAARGVIYDRNGAVLARNRPMYRTCEGISGPCTFISRQAGLEKESAGEPVEVVLGREYPEQELAAHVAGYMGEINADELKSHNDELRKKEGDSCPHCYLAGDWLGTSGVEMAFESTLRGKNGKKLIEVNAVHETQKELARVDSVDGANVELSLDLGLQRVAREQLAGKVGAVVASNPATGEIYALYSSPSFDPNVFVSDSVDGSVVNQLFADETKPLFNRAISGLYPPGSTFKIVVASAGLGEKSIDENTTVEDTGVLTIGPYSFANWYFTQYGKKEGHVTVVKAIQRSNDIFFYKVGEWTGHEKIESWANRFGFGYPLGIEIPGEEGGMIRADRTWYLGDTYHLAIGQGDLLTTPLQVNTMTAVIANGGNRCKPTVLKVRSTKYEVGSKECEDIGLSKETIQLVTEGMKEVCSEGGTAYPLFKFKVRSKKYEVTNTDSNNAESAEVEIPIACKTGTAEFGDLDKTHAWLTAFSPIENPEIAVTVLVEGGGEGSSVAAPIVKELLKEWFEQ